MHLGLHVVVFLLHLISVRFFNSLEFDLSRPINRIFHRRSCLHSIINKEIGSRIKLHWRYLITFKLAKNKKNVLP